MCRIALLPLAWLIVCLSSGPSAAEDFYLKDGDRVVFYGDSITAQREYTTRVEEFVLTRFPDMKVTFYHAGVGGDRVTGGGAGKIDERLARDVIRFKPTVVTIMLGMNDGGYKPFDQATFDRYASGYRHIVDRLQSELPGVRLTLIQPSAFDDVTRTPSVAGGYNDVLRRYGEFVEALGKERQALVVDFNTVLVDALTRVNQVNTVLARQILPDRVHPAPAGHWLMAETLLRAWHAPEAVSAIEIDASAPRVTRAVGTTITGLTTASGALTWTAHDAALPIPQLFEDGIMELVSAGGGNVPGLDRQTIAVNGLAPGRYRLVIDDERPGKSYTAEELAAGIDLGGTVTPMVWQAMSIRWSSEDKNIVHEQWMHAVMRSATDPDQAETARRLETVEATLTAEREAARHPAPHRFALIADAQ